MKDVMIFKNPDFGEIRTTQINGEVWFIGKDVAEALGYGDTDQALRKHVDNEDRITRRFDGEIGRGNPNKTMVNESGLYSLILSSKLPSAKKFKYWVTSEVLPSIRKTGAYSINHDSNEVKLCNARARESNARCREADIWIKLANLVPVAEYKKICASYASAVLAGKQVLPLPKAEKHFYSAAEVGEMLGGVSANKIGRIANLEGLKTPEYGIEVWDKALHSNKQIAAWRYNEEAVERLRELMEIYL